MATAPPSVNCAFAPPVPQPHAKPAITPINDPNLTIPFRRPHIRPPSIRIRKLLRRRRCSCSRLGCSATSACPSVRVLSHLLRLRFTGGVMPSMPKRQPKIRADNFLSPTKKRNRAEILCGTAAVMKHRRRVQTFGCFERETGMGFCFQQRGTAADC